ncbi:MAG: substrate-binding domain-containing protein [Verrucomicrobiota bacterium]
MIPKTSSLADDLAETLLNDIRERNLAEGTRYYTTAEVCEKFSVCTDSASRAMKSLASRNILVRLRRRGTFVGPGIQPDKNTLIRHLTVLSMPAHHTEPMALFFSLPYLLDEIMEDVSIQTIITEPGNDLLLLEELKNSPKPPDGIITGSRSNEVFKALSELNTPVVVMGTLDPGMPDLPSVDLDFQQAGQLLANYMFEKGHHRIVVQQCGNSGCDHCFSDAIAETMSAAHLTANNCMKVRGFQHDLEVAEKNLNELFGSKNHPTAVIARGEFLADVAATAVKQAGLCVGKDIDIGWTANSWLTKTQSPFVHVQPTLNSLEVANIVAEMLETQMKGEPLKERTVIIPAELCQPPRP